MNGSNLTSGVNTSVGMYNNIDGNSGGSASIWGRVAQFSLSVGNLEYTDDSL